MIPVYILLGIIAIGVLLLSEVGQEILGCLIRLLIIGIILFAGFWIVVIIWGLLSNKETQNVIYTIVGYIVIAGAIVYIIIKAYKKYKQGKFSRQAIKAKAVEIWQTDKQFIIVATSAIIFFILVWLLDR